MAKTLDKIKGCVFGGAIGDALGFTIEFNKINDIVDRYGRDGLQDYVLTRGTALFSDDTQMTLFTANGIMNAVANGDEKNTSDYVYGAYLDWLKTQYGKHNFNVPDSTWLVTVGELHSPRAPGNTCLTALMSGRKGTMEAPLNYSKGCGGVMRVAPFGLFSKSLNDKEVAIEAAKAAAITHGKPMGYISAATLADIVSKCSEEGTSATKSLKNIINASMKDINELFNGYDEMDEFNELVDTAIKLSENNMSDMYNIPLLGEGWVGDEALAIAIYASLKHSDDFSKAVIAAVNHSGDSDSTGAITGNILGAYLGYDKIDKKWLKKLELTNVLEKISNDLYKCQKNEIDKDFIKRYKINRTVGNIR